MLTSGKILMIAGWRYHFAALWGFLFWMIAFSRTFLWDVETVSSNFLLKSEGNHWSSQKFLLLLSMVWFSCLIIDRKAVKLLLTFVICMIYFSIFFHVILALDEVMDKVISFDILRSFFNQFTAQKMKFSITDFFSKCDQIRRKLRIWSHLPKKSVIENFIFCPVYVWSY